MRHVKDEKTKTKKMKNPQSFSPSLDVFEGCQFSENTNGMPATRGEGEGEEKTSSPTASQKRQNPNYEDSGSLEEWSNAKRKREEDREQTSKRSSASKAPGSPQRFRLWSFSPLSCSSLLDPEVSELDVKETAEKLRLQFITTYLSLAAKLKNRALPECPNIGCMTLSEILSKAKKPSEKRENILVSHACIKLDWVDPVGGLCSTDPIIKAAYAEEVLEKHAEEDEDTLTLYFD